MKVGEIFWFDLASRGGREQAGRRPAIVMQNEKASAVLSTVLVVPLTTQQAALRFPGTLIVDPDENNGLSHLSIAFVFQLTAVDTRAVWGRIGQISPEKVNEIRLSLAELMRDVEPD